MLWLLTLSLLAQLDAGASFVDRIRDPARRNEAVCAALTWDDPGPCVVRSVIESVDARREPLFVVFFRDHGETEDAGMPTGHFEVFDAHGKHLTWFANANALQDRDVLLRPTTGPLLVAQAMAQDVECGPSCVVQTLQLISIADPQHPLLSVIIGPPTAEKVVVRTLPANPGKLECYADVCGQVGFGEVHLVAPAFTWSWKASCDVQCKVELGPTAELTKGHPAATFRWQPGWTSFQGPRGAAGGGFLRYDSRNEDAAIDAFSRGHGLPPRPHFDGGCTDEDLH